MEDQNATVTPSDIPSEPATQIGPSQETIPESKESNDTLRSEKISEVEKKEEDNLETVSKSLQIVIDDNSVSTNENTSENRKASDDEKNETNILETETNLVFETNNVTNKIETTCPDESCKDIESREKLSEDTELMKKSNEDTNHSLPDNLKEEKNVISDIENMTVRTEKDSAELEKIIINVKNVDNEIKKDIPSTTTENDAIDSSIFENASVTNISKISNEREEETIEISETRISEEKIDTDEMRVNDEKIHNEETRVSDEKISTEETRVNDEEMNMEEGSDSKKMKDILKNVEDSSDVRAIEEIFIDRTTVNAATMNSEESSKYIDNESMIERTTEIIEFVELTNVVKIEESTTENSEVIEIIVQSSDEGNENGVKIVELEATTSGVTNEEEFLSAVNLGINEKSTKNDNETNIFDSNDTKVSHIQIDKAPSDERTNLENTEAIENGETILSEVNVSPSSIDAAIDKTNDSTSSSISQSSQSCVKQRSVIEDIFDDWQDENPEEETCQRLVKSHDSVEMELKILLQDEKSMDEPCNVKIDSKVKDNVSEKILNIEKSSNSSFADNILINERKTINEALKRETLKQIESDKRKNEITSITEATINPESLKIDKINESPAARERLMKQKPLAPRPGVKVPGILLTSPIVSKSAVSKVLKERIREQQKEFDSPTKPDLFFVKKITQRLSHKLAAASAAQVPGLLPIPQIGKSSATNEGKKTSSGVDKELLAILEGDVDPDWSNLKGPSLVEEAKGVTAIESNSPTKLDPAVERELALKQLLELPGSPTKKVTIKKIPVKPSRNKTVKLQTKATISQTSPKEQAEGTKSAVIESTIKDDSMDSSHSLQEYKIDETRSGRKRKPTEKAREHENSTKRLKIFKGQKTANKRTSQEDNNLTSTNPPIVDKNDTIDNTRITEIARDNEEKRKNDATSETTKKLSNDSLIKDSDESRNNELVDKKVTLKPNGKRKISTGQKLIRQKISPNKKSSLSLKGKFSKGIAKKTVTKLSNSKGHKQRNSESSQVEAKPKKKTINEIDRLLQDEGVVNLLYDVEQPDKKRLVPITKSQTKVMDLQKIQRELKIRTKLVRNAVLRLRTSNITTNKVSPRSKRSMTHGSDFNEEKKKSVTKSADSTSPTDFIYPAKIRNAADASIIIRRHSSSSFSSASASPRASIDTPERLSFDGGKFDESGTAVHILRSNKRRHSQDNDKKKKKQKQSPEPKRYRRKINDRTDNETKNIDDENLPIGNAGIKCKSSISGDADVPLMSIVKSKKFDFRKNQKSLKQHQQLTEMIDVDENSSNSSAGKISTRSNGATGSGGGKVMPKSKKSVKCKVTFAKGSDSINKKFDSPGQQDELSACLAEAVTALSNDSGGSSRSRSNIPVSRNKTKGNSNTSVKSFDIDEKKLKTESSVQFSNNEIMVQRHGKLVQLLLTPSTSAKIRNGITLQVMQEIRENLSILKKDEDCRVVLLTSTGTSFCEGLELSTLLHDNKEERRLRAEELANAVKEFIKSLATFNKPIVAGVQGTAIGLGVTMLPWFDLVIASDKATFSTPYGKLGQIAEGAAIFTLSHILGSAVTSELLLGGRTLTANEALRAGLVSRVLWPDRFKDELLPSLRAMSEQSSQSMEATKALLRHSLRKKLDAALESESYLLVQHWCSAECQTAIAAYVDEKIQ